MTKLITISSTIGIIGAITVYLWLTAIGNALQRELDLTRPKPVTPLPSLQVERVNDNRRVELGQYSTDIQATKPIQATVDPQLQ